VVGWSWFNVSELRALNPNGIFLLNPALTAAEGRDAVQVTVPGGATSWPGAQDDQPGGVNLGFIRAVDPAWDLLHNADGSYATMPNYARIKGWEPCRSRRKEDPRARLQDLRLRR
jgi:hypothetical protein